MKRRNVLKTLSLLPAISLVPVASMAQGAKKTAAKKPAAKKTAAKKTAAKAPATPKNLLDEKTGLGSAMKYVNDATKASPMRTNKKAICSNCAKYNVCAPTDKACKPADKKAKYAPCTVFPNKVVAGAGWCLSWQAKG